ncbi:MAG: hypothetical protein HWE30_04510 [Methylocystaceae bacterium]|nr:hypothetical protein [Methylocystaceae bacterium]
MVIFAASCTYQGGANDPVSRKFSWFSYINGDDIRKVCADLGTDRYRFVYNGIYQEQTRSYDIFFYARKMTMQVRGQANVAQFNLNDLFAPWRGVREDLVMNEKELSILRKSLKESAALHNDQKGLRLYADDFYWTVAACVDGVFHFDAYLWGTDHWNEMVFDDLLFSWDVTGVEPVKPRVLSKVDKYEYEKYQKPFLLEVSGNGLVGFQK